MDFMPSLAVTPETMIVWLEIATAAAKLAYASSRDALSRLLNALQIARARTKTLIIFAFTLEAPSTFDAARFSERGFDHLQGVHRLHSGSKIGNS
jgi:hypothetical protein